MIAAWRCWRGRLIARARSGRCSRCIAATRTATWSRFPPIFRSDGGCADLMANDISEFDFHLPPDRIAQHPARPRDAARLLHVTRDGLADRTVRDLPQLLRPGDVLVANDTKVIQAQLTAHRLHPDDTSQLRLSGAPQRPPNDPQPVRAGDAQSARIGITLDRTSAD